MVSALAAQLAQGVSLNAALISSSQKRRHYGHTYLFAKEEAGTHDLDSVYAIAQNGFVALASLDSKLESLGEALFSTAARTVDRTLLPPDQLATLKSVLAAFILRLSRFILEPPTAKVIEWLVRRFRVNEFDTDIVLECFIPFHDSAQFAKMLTILTIPLNSMWTFLKPFQHNLKPLPRTVLVNEMIKNIDLARFVASLVPKAAKATTLHRALSNFSSSVIIEYIARLANVTEGIVAFVLPAVTAPLSTQKTREMTLNSFVVLTALVQRVQMSPKALKAIIKTVLNVSDEVTTKELLMVLVALCSSREDILSLPDTLLSSLKEDADLLDIIPETLKWRGSDKFYLALVSLLLRRSGSESWSPVVFAIINAPAVTPRFVERIADLFLHTLNADQVLDVDFTTGVLSVISQRKPEAFRLAVARYAETLPESAKPGLEKFVADMALGKSVTGLGAGFLAISSDDPQVRLSGLRIILDGLRQSDVEAAFVESAKLKLMACIQDADLDIVKLAYDHPSILLVHLNDTVLLPTVAIALANPDLPRQAVKLHLNFLAKSYCSAYPGQQLKVFEEAFAKYLIFSKPRHKLASLAWSILKESTMGKISILDGCLELVPVELDVSGMAAVNEAITTKLAHNSQANMDFWFSKLRDTDPHLRNLALLVSRSHLLMSSSKGSIELAARVLDVMGISDLQSLSAILKDAQSLSEFIDYDSFSGSVVSKPSSQTTHHRIQASIVALLPGVSRPEHLVVEWLQHVKKNVEKDIGFTFVTLMRRLYTLANSSVDLHSLSTNLLRALFVGLGQDTLLFLAGIWTQIPPEADVRMENLHRTALIHAKAFLAAQAAAASSSPIDFQTVLPAFLVALGAPDKGCRRIATECIRLLAKMQREQRSIIYAVDTIYGNRTSQVQVLPFATYGRYLKAIAERCDNFIADPEYLAVFHRETFSSKESSKKLASFRQRFVCFIVSHAVAWIDYPVRLRLLIAIWHVSDPTKLTLVMPLVEELLARKSTPGEQLSTAYHAAIFSAFDASASELLNAEDSPPWKTFRHALECSIDSRANESMQVVPLRQLEATLFPHLSAERKLEACRLVISLAKLTTDGANYARVKGALPSFLSDSSTVIGLLSSLSAPLEPPLQPVTKRSKIDEVDDSRVPLVDRLQLLRLVAEALVTQLPSAKPAVVACIFDTIQTLCNIQEHAASAVDFIQQLLLTALDKTILAASAASIPTGTVRVQVLIELFRTTENPQTFQQALLIVSNIVRIDPDSVLHHVMPIFTFMGSNVFHRDDSFSFRVVQKTVESIVPVMVRSLKQTYMDRLQFLIGSRDFLRVFTDAALHVPRHRRTHFFTHLIDVLGPKNFLAPVTMLLVNKAANRVVRQDVNDASQTLTLPLTALSRQPHEMRLSALIETLEECKRLCSKIGDPLTSETVSFLELSLDDHSPSPSTATKKQVLALLIFVGHGIEAFGDHSRSSPDVPMHDTRIQRLVSLLVEMAHICGSDQSEALEEINVAAQQSLTRALAVLPAYDFVKAIADLLSLPNSRIQTGAARLLAERLPQIAPSARTALSPTVVGIIGQLRTLLSSAIEVMPADILHALEAISKTSEASEQGPLSSCVDVVLQVAGTDPLRSAAQGVLAVLTSKLGPRIIPQTSQMVTSSIVALESGASTEVKSSSLALLLEIVKSIPTFLGHNLNRIIAVCISCSTDDPFSGAFSILDVVTSAVPPRVLLPALSELWISTYASSERPSSEVIRFFAFCKSAIGAAPRVVVSEHLKNIFKMFLEALNLRSQLPAAGIAEVEGVVISAFLEVVTKLNEASFKPLFRRLFDWAFSADATKRDERKETAFLNTMSALLETFKNLIVPYMALLLDSVADLLEGFNAQSIDDGDLWNALVRMLHLSFIVDEGVFWRDDRLERLAHPIVKQISSTVMLNDRETKDALLPCLAEFAHTISREELLKTFHSAMLMETRSGDTRVQMFALQALTSVWKRNGSRLIGFAIESVSFVEDLAESDNDQIAKEARVFNRLMSGIGGAGAQFADL